MTCDSWPISVGMAPAPAFRMSINSQVVKLEEEQQHQQQQRRRRHISTISISKSSRDRYDSTTW
jgi:hypothetical protein